MSSQKLSHPLFLLSIFTLLLNDWCLKSAFHNELTGKLSDFAGLFALPFFLTALSPRHKLAWHILVSGLFIWWKSELAQPFIDMVNASGIPIARTIDFTDNIALLAVFGAYFTIKKDSFLQFSPVALKVIGFVACFAFFATTLPPREMRKFVDIGKEYQFNCSKKELISRLNIIQLKEFTKHKYRLQNVHFDSEANIFYRDVIPYEPMNLIVEKAHRDTLALLVDYEKVKAQDTLFLKPLLGEIQIFGDNTTSTLRLVNVYKITKRFHDKDYKEKAIKEFEKRVVEKLQDYR